MIGVQGIRLDTMTISAPDADGNRITNGGYSLMSTAGKALAKQQINVYGGMEVKFSPATLKAQADFLACVLADVNAVLGLGE